MYSLNYSPTATGVLAAEIQVLLSSLKASSFTSEIVMDGEESDSRQGVNCKSSSHFSEDKLSDFTSFGQKHHIQSL